METASGGVERRNAPARARRRRRRIVGGAIGGVFAILLLLIGLFYASGGRWFDVKTPSMGRAAPVGTLVITRPATEVKIGDIIAFKTRGERVFTHRVAGFEHGRIITKGDINAAPDPWRLTGEQVIGKVVARWWAVGWLLRALPWLMLGGLITWLAGAFLVRPAWRWPAWIVGGSITFTLVSWIVRPWLGAEMIAHRFLDTGTVEVSVVSTGILPIRAEAVGGTHADLIAGQVGIVQTSQVDAYGFFRVEPTLHMGFWWWVAALLVCLAPLLLSIIIGLPPLPPPPPGSGKDGDDGESSAEAASGGAAPTAAAALAAVALAAATAGTPQAFAAFGARISNGANNAGTARYFTCASAAQSSVDTFLTYPLGDRWTRVDDISGNRRTGSWWGSHTPLAAPVCPGDNAAGARFNGSNTCAVYTSRRIGGPQNFSVETWFRTSVRPSAKLIGFGTSSWTVSDWSYDRQLYLDKHGRMVFALYPGRIAYVASPPGTNYADGQWHHVVATLSPAGARLYMDGQRVAADPSIKAGENYSGYWKIGCGNLNNWRHADGSYYSGPRYFTGDMAYTSIHNQALDAPEVAARYSVGKP